MSTPFAGALSLCNLASVGIFGIVLSAAFCELEWTRQRKLLLAGCTVLMLALQGIVSLWWSTSFARYLYPVITHLPLVILLVAMTRKVLWSLIAVLTAYLCCQLRRWAALLVIALFPTGGTALQNATELVVTRLNCALEQKRFGLLAGLLGIAPREYLQFAPDAPVACPVQPSQPFRREPA